MTAARVSMGEPILTPSLIPAEFGGEQVFDCPITTDAGEFRVTALSMGNPHAVLWVEDVDAADVETIGPLIENHAKFPAKTNVEFAQLSGIDRFKARVWERGVGETLACGSGAAAAAALAHRRGLVGRRVTVMLPGGPLLVEVEGDRVWIEGPAVMVFRGVI